MNRFENELFAVPSSGRKGVAYDWQTLVATGGVAEIEAELARELESTLTGHSE